MGILKNETMIKKLLLITLFIVFILSPWLSPKACADGDIRLSIDGATVAASPAPFIENGRTLVPIRVISEHLGAEVIWDNEARSVRITKGDRSVLLRIDSNLIAYQISNENSYNLSDVAPKIIGERTFVPIRLISNALGVGVDWDEQGRTVIIESSKASSIQPFFDMNISSIKSGQTITGTVDLSSVLPGVVPAGATVIKYLLIDPDSAKGFIIARGNTLEDSYKWRPNIADNGEKILVAALYDSGGLFLAGDAIPIKVGILPKVGLTGVASDQIITKPVSLGADINFFAAYIRYEITNTDNGKTFTTSELDPLSTYQWAPSIGFNGNLKFSVTAYDSKKQPYPSQAVSGQCNVVAKLAFSGISENQTIDKPVTLLTSKNFETTETEFWIKDKNSGNELLLAKSPYGSYSWFAKPDAAGEKMLFARSKDASGITYTSNGISVKVVGTPKLLLQGVGPGQIITESVKLKVSSNLAVSSVEYTMINTKTGARSIIASGQKGSSEFTFTPDSKDAGSWKIKAEATYDTGKKIASEEVSIKIYAGKTYSSQPIIAENQFIGLSSQLAADTLKKTGMSAALQTAQAILESGWGQHVPVDKYNGQLSYNLFGIKGTGSAGSVTSNTWEEYNGVAFRTDADFRAYHSIGESWTDHNKLLLTVSRYEPYRDVMFDSSLGAWALKRCGYATDSKYPIKLMDIVELYHLKELDRIKI